MGLLDGKVAIVTGGGRGLGRAHCLALAAHGATVVVNDLGAGSARRDTDEIAGRSGGRRDHRRGRPGGRRPLARSRDWAATEKLIERTVKEFGRLDVVVNNAGILRDKMLFSMTEADFDAVIAVHLKGTFATDPARLRVLARRRPSAGSAVGGPRSSTRRRARACSATVGQANYGAAKAGIVSLTMITALEMAATG